MTRGYDKIMNDKIKIIKAENKELEVQISKNLIRIMLIRNKIKQETITIKGER